MSSDLSTETRSASSGSQLRRSGCTSLGGPTGPMDVITDTAGPAVDRDGGGIVPMDEDDDREDTPRKTRLGKRAIVVSPTQDMDEPRAQRRRQLVSVHLYIYNIASDILTMFIDILWSMQDGRCTGMCTPAARKGQAQHNRLSKMCNQEDAVHSSGEMGTGNG
jgi:hypothetical protein